MEQGNNIRKFDAHDIERYHRGEMSGQERHALEKAALEDPFLADALEGFALPGSSIADDMAKLKNRLADRLDTGARGTGGSPAFWLRIAAVVVMVAGAAVIISRLAGSKQSPGGELATITRQDTVATAPLSEQQTEAVGTDSAVRQPEQNLAMDKQDVTTQAPAGKSQAQGSGSPAKHFFITTTPPPPPPITAAPGRQEDKNSSAAPTVTTRAEAGYKTSSTETAPAEVASAVQEKKEADKAAANEEAALRRQKAAAGNRMVANNNAVNQAMRAPAYNVYRGTVTDHDNNGLPFVNVTNLEDGIGTYTDARGNFTLLSTDTALNLQVRALGFNTANVELRNGRGYDFLNYGKPQERRASSQADQTLNRVILEEDRNVAAQTLLAKPIVADRNNWKDSMRLQEEAEPQDGWKNYNTYVYNNLKVPDEALRAKKNNAGTGSVEVSFEVNKMGQPVNFKIERSLCPSCDEEAIRLIREGPKWKRMKKGRTTVTVSF